jgi:cation diffusion facilitator CzcD-associated flavoprotein CzcO
MAPTSSHTAAPLEPQAIIIGAGPAGLAVAASLSRLDVPFVILEREQTVAASWRRHYDRLHLHTNKGTSALPYMAFPQDYPRYPSRDQVVAYVEAYARAFGIEPRFNEDVLHARPCDGGWEVVTATRTYRAPHLVVATGLNQEPVVPEWPGQDSFRTHPAQPSVSHRAGFRGRARSRRRHREHRRRGRARSQ